MAIWIATFPQVSHPDLDKFDTYRASPGWSLMQRKRGMLVSYPIPDSDPVDLNLNVYALVHKTCSEANNWWVHPRHSDGPMTEEAQTIINRALCELAVLKANENSNLFAFWYLPRGMSPDAPPDEQGYTRSTRGPIADLRTVNLIRASWLTRLFCFSEEQTMNFLQKLVGSNLSDSTRVSLRRQVGLRR